MNVRPGRWSIAVLTAMVLLGTGLPAPAGRATVLRGAYARASGVAAGPAAASCRVRPGHTGGTFSVPLLCLHSTIAADGVRQGIAASGEAGAAWQRAASDAVNANAVLPSGDITTYAGGLSGGGNGAPIRFGLEPEGVALAGAGQLVIADAANGVVWLANLTSITSTLFGRTIAPNRMVVVAGDGFTGFSGDGGPATLAKLNGPAAVAVDGGGNLLIADSYNNRIRKVLAGTDIIATIVGGGSGCPQQVNLVGDGCIASSADLYFPNDVVADGQGHLLIADTLNERIREVVDSTGIITTVAGTGTSGFSGDGGAAIAAELAQPYGVSADQTGDLFIADRNNNRIREVVSASGVITTVAGTGTAGFSGNGGAATAAELNLPEGVTVDNSGNLLVADSNNNRIREVVTSTGVITALIGNGRQGFSGDGGPAIEAALNAPRGVAVDAAGNVFVVDQGNNRVREVALSTHIITTVAGNGTLHYGGDSSPATHAELDSPTGVAVDRAGNLFITDSHDNRIREVLFASGIITDAAGNGSAGFGGDGGPATSATLNGPSGVAIDASGNLFIADTHNNRVREVAARTGIISTVAGTGVPGFNGDGGPATRAALHSPTALAFDSAGNLYIADNANQRVREVQAGSGIITTIAGTGVPGFSGDGGPGPQAQLYNPSGVTVDKKGNVFIADTDNERIREVLAGNGVIITAAGVGTPGFSGDGGPATQAQLNRPAGLAEDSVGNLVIADQANNRIREVLASTGTITAAVGNGVAGFSGDGGPAIRAELSLPAGVVADGSGHLYIADYGNMRVRLVNHL